MNAQEEKINNQQEKNKAQRRTVKDFRKAKRVDEKVNHDLQSNISVLQNPNETLQEEIK